MALALTAALTFTPIAVMGERWIPAEYLEAIRRKEAANDHTSGNVTTPPPTQPTIRELVAAYFPPWAVDQALEIIRCESGGDAGATNSRSGAAGLFQHLPRYWAARSAAAGWAGADIYNPVANVAVAAYLVATDGWWHWNASRGCW